MSRPQQLSIMNLPSKEKRMGIALHHLEIPYAWGDSVKYADSSLKCERSEKQVCGGVGS